MLGPASANVTYDFVGSLTNTLIPYTTPFGPTGADLVVTDAAVASGSMNFGLGGVSGNTGDDSGFVSLTTPGFYGQTFTKFDNYGFAAVGVLFDTDGTLTGDVIGLGISSGFQAGGSEFNWTGTEDDDGSCGAISTVGPPRYSCTYSGYWIRSDLAVPEPSSAWLFLGGMSALLLIWRLKRIR